MAIFRWGSNLDPLAGLRVLQREVDRLLWPWVGGGRRIGGGEFPLVNVFASPTEVLVQCEVPGMEAKDLNVDITGDTLTVRGAKPAVPNEQDLNFARRELGSGEFTRTIVLPDPVEGDKVQASLANGVLTIRLPKTAAAQPKRIEVRPGR